jgi:hypothetical protein
MRVDTGVWAGCVAALVFWSGATAFAATDVIFQRKGADGTLELTNVPAGDNYSPVATNTPTAAPGAPGARVPGTPQPAAAVPPPPPGPSPEMAQAAAFAKELDAKAPVTDGNTNMRHRMESLYEASRAAREARMQEVQQQQGGRAR